LGRFQERFLNEMSLLIDFSGARVRRVLDPSGAVVAEHAHDWPMISLYVMGGYRNFTHCGEREIAGPSIVFYRPGAAHRNVAGETGFEQIEIEFDPGEVGRSPAWIGPAYRSLAARVRVERAARLLRESDEPLSAVAIEAGFCDQSHMNRTFRRVLGRLPTAVRGDRQFFRRSR
jgi:hypothetical protein